ncbi:MAG: phosphodiesterase [Clostridiales bacterium]|nr:phosphodiesterase [Clostridiales bacterium]
MKIMVASDIHGSSTWCRRILEVFDKEGADKLLLLGDILYHGPRNDVPSDYSPKEVTAMLNDRSRDILAVRGNCDAEVDDMVLKFPVRADYIWLMSGELTIFATHGHLFDMTDLPFDLPSGSVVLFGHIHVTMDRMKDGLRYMNPGSPSIPKEDSVPSYIIIEDGELTLKEF